MTRQSGRTTRKRRAPAARLPVTLRLPKSLVARIEQDLDSREIPLSRNSWLLEAVLEKLERSSTGGSNGAR